LGDTVQTQNPGPSFPPTDDRRHSQCRDTIEQYKQTIIRQGHDLRAAEAIAKELETLIELVRAHRTIRPSCPTMMPTQSAEMSVREFRKRRGRA
jgi:hypothetical protein